MKFDTLKEQHAKRNPEDLEIDYGMRDSSKSYVVDLPLKEQNTNISINY